MKSDTQAFLKHWAPWACAAWLSVVAGGMAVLWTYATKPGADAHQAPSRWPAESGIERVPGLPTLLLFAHPRCSCTRASLGELARIVTRAPRRASVRVVFFTPQPAPDAWLDTDLWRSAQALPDVKALRDDRGEEARRFGATTSGQTLLYDAAGRLVFQGGITAARAEAGDNLGENAVVSWLLHGSAERSASPVFGCALRSDRAVRSEAAP